MHAHEAGVEMRNVYGIRRDGMDRCVSMAEAERKKYIYMAQSWTWVHFC